MCGCGYEGRGRGNGESVWGSWRARADVTNGGS